MLAVLPKQVLLHGGHSLAPVASGILQVLPVMKVEMALFSRHLQRLAMPYGGGIGGNKLCLIKLADLNG